MICKFIVKDPVSPTCNCVMCREHLHDGTIKNQTIKCSKCDERFEVPEFGFAANKLAKNILANEFHLRQVEKTVKCEIQDLIQQLEQLQIHLKQTHSRMDRLSHTHFSDIRRQINFHRDQISEKNR